MRLELSMQHLRRLLTGHREFWGHVVTQGGDPASMTLEAKALTNPGLAGNPSVSFIKLLRGGDLDFLLKNYRGTALIVVGPNSACFATIHSTVPPEGKSSGSIAPQSGDYLKQCFVRLR